MTEATVNANIAHCFRTINRIGSNEVVNICNGTHNVIPWGSLDWLIFVILTAFGLALLAFLCIFIIAMVWGDL